MNWILGAIDALWEQRVHKKMCMPHNFLCSFRGRSQEHFDRNTPRREAPPNGSTPALQGEEASYNGLDAY
jgi:hypothetical protein